MTDIDRKNQPFHDIERPQRYNSHPSGHEAIELCELLCFNLGTALKYLFRLGLKDDPLRELQKARWYLRRHFECSNDPATMVDDFPDTDSADRFARYAEEVMKHEQPGSLLHEVLDCIAHDLHVTRALERVEREIMKLMDAEIATVVEENHELLTALAKNDAAR
jgi:hypothetical protein